MSKVTDEARAYIWRATQAGQSSRDITANLKKTFGVSVDRRTVSRIAKEQPPDSGSAGQAQDLSGSDGIDLSDPLGLLRHSARELAMLVRSANVHPRDKAAAAGELRKLLAEIDRRQRVQVMDEHQQEVTAAKQRVRAMLALIKGGQAADEPATGTDGA